MSDWAILVHGGAKTIKPDQEAAHRAGCLAAARAGQAVLAAGGAATAAVVAAILVLENDPTFNAGFGSVQNSDGEVECDAALMDGETLDVGAVAAVQGVRNPIKLAEALLADTPVLLAGAGARRYAAEKGLELCDARDLIAPGPADDAGCDTVGCVALDARGRLAAGTSTGGLAGVRPGRVGDSPVPGSGLLAETGVGAVSFSGDGESILRLTLAARIAADLPRLGSKAASVRALGQLERIGGEAGCIVIDAEGRPAMTHNSDHFAVAYASATIEPRAMLHQDEFPNV